MYGLCIYYTFFLYDNKKVKSSYVRSLAQLSLCLSMPDYMYQLIKKKGKKPEKHCTEVGLEYTLMDLPLIAESCFLQFDIV